MQLEVIHDQAYGFATSQGQNQMHSNGGNVTTADSRYLNKIITIFQIRAPSDGCVSSPLGAKTASIRAM
jgi:hypothetical protein